MQKDEVTQDSLITLSEKEELSVENSLIDVLNTLIRTFQVELKGEDMESYLWRILEKKDFGYPALDKATLCKIISRVSDKAKKSGFPKEKIPRQEVRITIKDVLKKGVGKESILTTEKVLSWLGEYMESCGDPRGEKITEAFFVINEIVLTD